MNKKLPLKRLTNLTLMLLVIALTNSFATTFTVANNSSTATAGSLTTAINSANASPGKDTIVFNSNYAITNQATLTISDSLVIDATKQASYPSSYVSITGNGTDLYGIVISENTELYGIRIGNYSVASVLVSTNKSVSIGELNKGNILQGASVGLYIFSSNNCSVKGNRFCISENGTLLSPGNYGIYALNSSNINIGASTFATGGNWFAQNNTSIGLDNCNNVIVIGNRIGSDISGTALLGALGQTGIYVTNSSTQNMIGSVGSGNQIVNMSARAILIDANSSNNIIASNLIGVDQSGLFSIPNFYGIELNNTNKNIIGGPTAASRNIISGNVTTGVYLHGNSRGNSILNNYIGVGSNGAVAIGNGSSGVELNDLTSVVDSNNIGDVNGANIIANNGSNGIFLNGNNVIKNSIRRNSIYCNNSNGVSLTNGANAIKAAPVITTANTCQIVGTSAANDFIELYINHNCSGSQGRTFLGSSVANASGNWSYSLGGYSATDELVAIAIGSNRNTSPFSSKLVATTCTLPTGSFPVNQCGYTTQTLSGVVRANAIVGASAYEFTFFPVGSSMPYATKITNIPTINFATVTPILQWGTLYDLRVRPIVGGSPGFYSPVCSTGLMNDPSNVANIGTTAVRAQFCLPNNMKLNGTIRCNPVIQATNYEFRITDNITQITQTVQGNGVNLALSSVVPALIVGRTYDISVRAKVYGFWGNYGAVQTINIASASRENFIEIINDNNDNSETIVFPNPFSKQISISSNNSNLLNCTIQIIDICGKVVVEEKFVDGQTSINTAHLPSGVYFLRTDSKTPIHKKLIKY